MTTMLRDKIDAVADALTLNPAASRIREIAVGELVGDFRVAHFAAAATGFRAAG